MKFKVVLYENEEGVGIGCPSLPGCWSQGKTREEALENIQVGIREFLEVTWNELAQEIADNQKEDNTLVVSLANVEVDVDEVESVPEIEVKV